MKQKRRFSRGMTAALALVVALGGLVALSDGAKASLIGDSVNVVATVCADFGLGDCDDTVTVVDPTAEFTSTQIIVTDIGTNLLSTQGTASFININDSTVDFFFDFGFFSQFIFTGLEWQDVSGSIGTPTFNVTTGNLSSDPQFTNVTASTFTVSVDCGLAPLCSFATGGVGFTVFLNPTHDEVPVPEPDTLALFCVGLVGLGWLMRRRRRQAA